MKYRYLKESLWDDTEIDDEEIENSHKNLKSDLQKKYVETFVLDCAHAAFDDFKRLYLSNIFIYDKIIIYNPKEESNFARIKAKYRNNLNIEIVNSNPSSHFFLDFFINIYLLVLLDNFNLEGKKEILNVIEKFNLTINPTRTFSVFCQNIRGFDSDGVKEYFNNFVNIIYNNISKPFIHKYAKTDIFSKILNIDELYFQNVQEVFTIDNNIIHNNIYTADNYDYRYRKNDISDTYDFIKDILKPKHIYKFNKLDTKLGNGKYVMSNLKYSLIFTVNDYLNDVSTVDKLFDTLQRTINQDIFNNSRNKSNNMRPELIRFYIEISKRTTNNISESVFKDFLNDIIRMFNQRFFNKNNIIFECVIKLQNYKLNINNLPDILKYTEKEQNKYEHIKYIISCDNTVESDRDW